MLRSSNDLTQRQSFSVKVQQRTDGRYEAICKNTDKVPPTVANSAQVAMAMMDTQLQKLHEDGKL